jgi:hypothetical protein
MSKQARPNQSFFVDVYHAYLTFKGSWVCYSMTVRHPVAHTGSYLGLVGAQVDAGVESECTYYTVKGWVVV